MYGKSGVSAGISDFDACSGIDQQGDPKKAAEWIEDHPKAHKIRISE
jgi:hypothetical protein